MDDFDEFDDDDEGDAAAPAPAEASIADLQRQLRALRGALEAQRARNESLGALAASKSGDAAATAAALREELDASEEERIKTLKLVVKLVGPEKCAALLRRGDAGVAAVLAGTAPRPKNAPRKAGSGSCATNPFVSGTFGPRADAMNRCRANEYHLEATSRKTFN